jgi:hypothetical protein
MAKSIKGISIDVGKNRGEGGAPLLDIEKVGETAS